MEALILKTQEIRINIPDDTLKLIKNICTDRTLDDIMIQIAHGVSENKKECIQDLGNLRLRGIDITISPLKYKNVISIA